MALSTAAKRLYCGGSKRIFNKCGSRTCPVNSKIIKILYYERNKDSVKSRANSRLLEDKRRYKKTWKSKNKGVVAASVASRKAHIRQATPRWLTKEQKKQIKGLYIEADRLKTDTGVDYEVDHIIPIRGGTVSGLHVPWNLRVITAEENQKKNRKLLDDTEAY
jgi:5-methylcytosine-specific restriction endonuclease McrA